MRPKRENEALQQGKQYISLQNNNQYFQNSIAQEAERNDDDDDDDEFIQSGLADCW